MISILASGGLNLLANNSEVIEDTVVYPKTPIYSMIITLIPTFIGLLVWITIIICLILFVKSFMSMCKERKLIRMELGKLADEVHRIREKLDA